MKILKWAAISLAVLLVIIQFVRPVKTNPPIDEGSTIHARARVPSEVAAILERSCSDCHSHKTRWPWYSQIAPISWLLAHDVNEGREHLNLSNWSKYNPRRAAVKQEEICE